MDKFEIGIVCSITIGFCLMIFSALINGINNENDYIAKTKEFISQHHCTLKEVDKTQHAKIAYLCDDGIIYWYPSFILTE